MDACHRLPLPTLRKHSVELLTELVLQADSLLMEASARCQVALHTPRACKRNVWVIESAYAQGRPFPLSVRRYCDGKHTEHKQNIHHAKPMGNQRANGATHTAAAPRVTDCIRCPEASIVWGCKLLKRAIGVECEALQ